MKNVPWPERDLKSVHEAATVVLGQSQHESFHQRFRESYRDIKREDALLVLSTLQSERRLLKAARSFAPSDGLSR
jgi:hypothetical protein